MLTVFVPPGESGYFEENKVINGTATKIKYAPRPYNGRLVVDLPLPIFLKCALLGANGLLWERENVQAMAWIGQNGSVEQINNAFPGASRPPPIPTVESKSTPAMIKMIAPEGVSSFSHDGVDHKVGKDRSITVAYHVADVLRSHGFRDAA
jgi:hypothetical protein